MSEHPTTDECLELRVSRRMPATPEEVFDAYTDAEKQKIWFSILDETPGIVEIEVDLRVGGTQTAIWGPSRDQLFREVQTFLEIDRPHRLVTSSVGYTPDGESMATRIVITFEPDSTRPHNPSLQNSSRSPARRRHPDVGAAVRLPHRGDPRLLRRRAVDRCVGPDRRLPGTPADRMSALSGDAVPPRVGARSAAGRPWLVLLAAVAAAVVINLLVYGIGRLAGGAFAFTATTGPAVVTPSTVAGFTAIPLAVGLIMVVLLVRRWRWVAPVGSVVAPALALITIVIMTLPADLDPISTVTLAGCHLTLAAISVLAIRRLTREAG